MAGRYLALGVFASSPVKKLETRSSLDFGLLTFQRYLLWWVCVVEFDSDELRSSQGLHLEWSAKPLCVETLLIFQPGSPNPNQTWCIFKVFFVLWVCHLCCWRWHSLWKGLSKKESAQTRRSEQVWVTGTSCKNPYRYIFHEIISLLKNCHSSHRNEILL